MSLLAASLIAVSLFAGGLFATDRKGSGRDDGSIHTSDYYDHSVRKAFKRQDWENGKRLLDEGLKHYPEVSALNELAGQYFYHHKSYDDARFHLIKAVRDNGGNVQAKQLLVNVEEDTKNYSSAICYVNELLEVNPYWKSLWRRKISLFRKQGNDEEADRLLSRICKIYPNDEQLKKDYTYRLEQHFREQKKSGDKDKTIASLRELVANEPTSEEYYLTLCNLLLQQGNRSEAIEVADRGVSYIPGSTALIIKKAGILAEENRYGEAMGFVELCMKQNHSGQLSSFYNSLRLDAARAEARRDPYVLYGKVYESSKSQEALDYMLSTSISRGYYEDALYYIGEARKRQGDTPALLYKAYVVNKRMGNERTANSMLSRLYERNPQDRDVAEELCRVRLEQSTRLMNDGAYAEALNMLNFVTEHSTEADLRESAYSRIVTCNIELRRFDAAEEALETLHKQYPERSGYVAKRADLYEKRGHTEQALAFLEKEINETTDGFDRFMYVSSYEEIATPYIKTLMGAGAVNRAYAVSQRLLDLLPSSEAGLQYAVNASAQLQRWDEHDKYVAQGLTLYPDDRFYIVKQAGVYYRKGEYASAVGLIRPQLDEFTGDTLLVKAYSAGSADWASTLIKAHKADSALAVVDSALVYDRNNRNLLYVKGLAFEALHEYDSAYVYQKYYIPGIGEMRSFNRHLDALRAHEYKNGLNFEYLQGRFGEEDALTAVATIEYTRKINKKNAIAARVNYAGREGAVAGSTTTEQVAGGTGVQLQAEWEHEFNDRWAFKVNGAWANKYFPQVAANAQVAYTFKNDWQLEAHAGYRRLNSYEKAFKYAPETYDESRGEMGFWTFDNWKKSYNNLVSFGLGTTKAFGDFSVGAKLDGYLLSSKYYFNFNATAKYYLLGDGKTCVMALAGLGSAPETTMIDYAMPNTFNHLNTNVGLGGQLRVHRNITLGVMGTWYTYYTQNNARTGSLTDYTDYITTKYKNLFNIDAQVLISF